MVSELQWSTVILAGREKCVDKLLNVLAVLCKAFVLHLRFVTFCAFFDWSAKQDYFTDLKIATCKRPGYRIWGIFQTHQLPKVNVPKKLNILGLLLHTCCFAIHLEHDAKGFWLSKFRHIEKGFCRLQKPCMYRSCSSLQLCQAPKHFLLNVFIASARAVKRFFRNFKKFFFLA